MKIPCGHVPVAGGSGRAKGDSANDLAAEAVLEPLEDFTSAISHDFIEPDAAVHSDKQRAVVITGGLCMCCDVRVHEMIPHFEDLTFRLPLVEPEIPDDFAYNAAQRLSRKPPLLLEWREIHAAPLAEHAPPRVHGILLLSAHQEGGNQSSDVLFDEIGPGGFVLRVLVKNQHAVRRQVVISSEILAGEEVVHRLVKLDSHRGILVI